MSLTVFAHSPTKFLSQESNNAHTVWNVGKLYIPAGFIVLKTEDFVKLPCRSYDLRSSTIFEFIRIYEEILQHHIICIPTRNHYSEFILFLLCEQNGRFQNADN